MGTFNTGWVEPAKRAEVTSTDALLWAFIARCGMGSSSNIFALLRLEAWRSDGPHYFASIHFLILLPPQSLQT